MVFSIFSVWLPRCLTGYWLGVLATRPVYQLADEEEQVLYGLLLQVLEGGIEYFIHIYIYIFIHSFSSLSYDRSKASTKASSPHSAIQSFLFQMRVSSPFLNPLNPELNPICCLLALLEAHHFLHVSRIRVKLLTLRLLMSYIYIYIYGAPILDVSRSHTTTQHSR